MYACICANIIYDRAFLPVCVCLPLCVLHRNQALIRHFSSIDFHARMHKLRISIFYFLPRACLQWITVHEKWGIVEVELCQIYKVDDGPTSPTNTKNATPGGLLTVFGAHSQRCVTLEKCFWMYFYRRMQHNQLAGQGRAAFLLKKGGAANIGAQKLITRFSEICIN